MKIDPFSIGQLEAKWEFMFKSLSEFWFGHLIVNQQISDTKSSNGQNIKILKWKSTNKWY